MNDPNGPIFWKGQYHMFYQHNPNGAFWGTMHWGHAVSPDLVHWKHLPIALAPTPGGADKDGCFSGCAVDNHGVPTLVYTGVSPEVQCLATTDDAMITWRKFAGNPVIGAPPSGMETTGFRDPCVWRAQDTWYMGIGSGLKGVGGLVLLYRSKDLIHWEYMHPLCEGRKDDQAQGEDPVAMGEMWECPDFFPLDGKHVLLISTQGSVRYFVGTYSDHRLRPEAQGSADFGGQYYAARSMLDEKGRRILWGWIKEGRSAAAQRDAGWAGVMSLPRVLTLGVDNTLALAPAPEVEVLRGKHHRFANLLVTPASSSLFKGVNGDSLEIAAELDPMDAQDVGLKVRCTSDGIEQTTIAYDCASKLLKLSRGHSSLSTDVDRGIQDGPLDLMPSETVKLHIFLDGSVVEVFANGRVCITSRIYSSREDSLGLGLFARGGNAKLKSMDIWEMRPISKDRLTT